MIDQVAANSDANAVRVFLLWTIIYDNLTIRDCPVSGDIPNLFGGKDEDCVGPIGDAWFALCQWMYLFGHCQYPEMLEIRIMLQFLVLCYGLLGDGVACSFQQGYDPCSNHREVQAPASARYC